MYSYIVLLCKMNTLLSHCGRDREDTGWDVTWALAAVSTCVHMLLCIYAFYLLSFIDLAHYIWDLGAS